MIIDNGKISHNEKLHAFTIEGTGGNAHCVHLFPIESCTCPATSQCYQILAARISIGPNMKPKKVNLSQLRRNTRARKDKTSGRKRPRINDFDVVPAPDSIKLCL